MKRVALFLKKCKRGFSLMECVCALALVGLISTAILPLTSSALQSLRTSNSIRSTASSATDVNATRQTSKENGNQKTMYVTVSYTVKDGNKTGSLEAESAFVFTESTATSGDNTNVTVTYYDLKYGKETEDPS